MDLYSDAFSRFELIKVPEVSSGLSFLPADASSSTLDEPQLRLSNLPSFRDSSGRSSTTSAHRSANYASMDALALPSVGARTALSEDDEADGTPRSRTLSKQRVTKARSMAPPDVLRYGKYAEDEMRVKDSLIDQMATQNADLEDILCVSNDILKESATAHFRRRMEEHYKTVAVNRMLDKGTTVGGDAPMMSITVQVNYDDYSRRPLAQTESKLLRKFTPEALGLRERPHPSTYLPPMMDHVTARSTAHSEGSKSGRSGGRHPSKAGQP
eukprot:RCo018177